jgi:hypothetical protein
VGDIKAARLAISYAAFMHPTRRLIDLFESKQSPETKKRMMARGLSLRYFRRNLSHIVFVKNINPHPDSLFCMKDFFQSIGHFGDKTKQNFGPT